MPSQRDAMRRFWQEHRNQGAEAVINAYAKAEMSGEVERRNNSSKRDPYEYARALLNDGLKKGWLSSAPPAAAIEQTLDDAARKDDHNKAESEHLKSETVSRLLLLHSAVLEELRARGVVRSANNPTGDLAEYLFCLAFGWDQQGNSARAFDAIDGEGCRVQIKGRRIHRRNQSRQLSAIRDLDGFDILAAVLFDDDFRVIRAALVPADVVRAHSSYVEHSNSYRFLLRDQIWELSGVKDVTGTLQSVQAE
ncbi:hypothetical protein [Chachezhania antarctica]|uniref:hypothetical protein n=1 Tax=Chachezhania antarctica TaxID=2340860 RepID=UPI0019691473|nr:hypothetical protein [Chachezhania antarctica]